MNIASLLPGLREIRGPLAAGYLWLASLWMVLGDEVPDRDGPTVIQRLYELGDALGPVGLAAVASVAAYLVGSIMHSLLGALFRVPTAAPLGELRVGGISVTFHPREEERAEAEPRQHPREVLETVEDAAPTSDFDLPPTPSQTWKEVDGLEVPGPLYAGRARDVSASRYSEISKWVISFLRWMRAPLGEGAGELAAKLVDDETRTARDRLHQAVDNERLAPVLWRRAGGDRVMMQIPPSDDEYEVPVPPSVARLIEDFPLIRSRLAEVSPGVSNKVEQIFGEAEFRLAIAPPLALVVTILAVSASLFYALLLVIPAVLVMQASVLRKQGGAELVDALRSRSESPQLEQVTPIFKTYREKADVLRDALRTISTRALRQRGHSIADLPHRRRRRSSRARNPSA